MSFPIGNIWWLAMLVYPFIHYIQERALITIEHSISRVCTHVFAVAVQEFSELYTTVTCIVIEDTFSSLKRSNIFLATMQEISDKLLKNLKSRDEDVRALE